MNIRIDFTKTSDEELDQQLSDALVKFAREGKERDYALCVIQEWRRRFRRLYFKNWTLLEAQRFEQRERERERWSTN